jgi:UPF0755 protein
MDSNRKNIFFVILLLILIGSIFLWSAIYLPVNPNSNETINFSIERGEGAKEISKALSSQKIIKYSPIFRFYALVTGQAKKLQAGNYEVSPSMNVAKIVSKFSKGDVIKEKIVVLEGWNMRDIAKYFQDQKICTEEEFIDLTRSYSNNDISSLKDKPKGLDIEGYLFPDTYEVAPDTSVQDIIKKILLNFDSKLSSDLRGEIVHQKKSIFDIVTMASLIEREVKTSEEKKIVSGILWKRINIGMPLQVDATVVYITDRQPTLDDLQIDSPYNTYKYYGLPKGPISNPGLDSIIAAIYPTKTDYLYYLSTPEGKTIFSKTFAEHAVAIKKYLK